MSEMRNQRFLECGYRPGSLNVESVDFLGSMDGVGSKRRKHTSPKNASKILQACTSFSPGEIFQSFFSEPEKE